MVPIAPADVVTAPMRGVVDRLADFVRAFANFLADFVRAFLHFLSGLVHIAADLLMVFVRILIRWRRSLLGALAG